MQNLQVFKVSPKIAKNFPEQDPDFCEGPPNFYYYSKEKSHPLEAKCFNQKLHFTPIPYFYIRGEGGTNPVKGGFLIGEIILIELDPEDPNERIWTTIRKREKVGLGTSIGIFTKWIQLEWLSPLNNEEIIAYEYGILT